MPTSGPSSVAGPSKWKQFGQSLLAILAGNAIYFGLNPHLPPALQHRSFHMDWGIAVAFIFCVAAYGLIRLVDSL
jgi:hypothetical protein